MDLSILCLVIAIVLFVIAAVAVAFNRVNLIALGLAFFAASFAVERL